MKKLINGIVEFQKKIQPAQRETFAKLALGQSPDTLFIVCSDSRVAPNVFASTDPGDLFVIRNVGNLIPPCGGMGLSIGDESEVAALEFAILNLKVKDIVICGHSECGAMHAIYNGRENLNLPHLRSWLVHGQLAFEKLKAGQHINPSLAPHNELSQMNVLQQLSHLKTYPIVQERLDAGTINLQGWWFNIAEARVYAYNDEKKKFVPIDDAEAERIISHLNVVV